MQLPRARATIAIGAATALAWATATVAGQMDRLAVAAGFIPARFSAGGQLLVETTFGAEGLGFVPALITPLTATLIHGGLLHLAFNLLMLGFCGRFVEVALGGRGLLALYAAGAYLAAGTQYVAGPQELSPMIGASGAVSALLGAYALLFGERRGWLATHRFGKALHILWLATAWIAFQLLIGIAAPQEGAAIAIAAHIGGFTAGLLLAKPLLRWRYRNA